MFKRNALTAVAVIAGLAGAPLLAQAADGKPASEASASPEVKAELAKLKKQVGAGEISSKEYKLRKEALLAGKPVEKK